MAACNQPECLRIIKKTGRKYYVTHNGICDGDPPCPHHGQKHLDVLPPHKHPCYLCRAGDSREQGHGRGFSFEEAPPDMVADREYDMPMAFDEEQPISRQEIVKTVLLALLQLKPAE